MGYLEVENCVTYFSTINDGYGEPGERHVVQPLRIHLQEEDKEIEPIKWVKEFHEEISVTFSVKKRYFESQSF